MTEPSSSKKNTEKNTEILTKKTSENSHTVTTERVQTAAAAQTKNENSKSLTTSIVVPVVIIIFIAVLILIVWFAKRLRYISLCIAISKTILRDMQMNNFEQKY